MLPTHTPTSLAEAHALSFICTCLPAACAPTHPPTRPQALQDAGYSGRALYEAAVQGAIYSPFMVVLPASSDRERLHFYQGDVCELPSDLRRVDCVLAADLLSRLPDPIAFLQRCAMLIKPGGVLVLASPHWWLKAWTPEARKGDYKVRVV